MSEEEVLDNRMNMDIFLKDLFAKLADVERVVFNDEEYLSAVEMSRFSEELLEAVCKLTSQVHKNTNDIYLLKKAANFDDLTEIAEKAFVKPDDIPRGDFYLWYTKMEY